jgi:hypothetical protein
VKTGQITGWTFQGKSLINAARATSPIELKLSDGSVATFVAESFTDEARGLTVRGQLKGKALSIPAEIRYEVSADVGEVHVAVSVAKPQDQNTEMSLYRWALPLALNHRKRVYFRGEYGLDWETRYFYQFLANTGGLLPEPDRNEWRWFGLDQMGPKAFRLWKSESASTSPLLMQEGRSMPPYVQIFDEQGGVTVVSPDMAAKAPQSIRVDASEGGLVAVEFWPTFAGPIAVGDTKGVFDVKQEVILTAAPSEAALVEARLVLDQSYPPSTRPDTNDVLKEPKWIRDEAIGLVLPQFVTGGYPFSKGELRDSSLIEVQVGGVRVPVQSKTLGYWPDRSVKWALLTFPIDPAQAVDECASPRVSLRNGKFIPVEITIGREAIKAATGLEVSPIPNEGVQVRNEGMVITFSKGKKWLSVTKNGLEVIPAPAERRLAYADYLLNPMEVFPFDDIASGGKLDPGVLSVSKITIEENGPLRTVVRLEGLTDNKEPTRIIVRAEMEAGRPLIRLTHTAEFLFKDPRETFLQGLGFEIPLKGFHLDKAEFGAAPARDGSTMGGLLQATRFSRELMLKEATREWKMPLEGEGGWVTAKSDESVFFGAVRNFSHSAPKAITIAPSGDAVRFEIWPESVHPMDVRRYSNFPHLGQGEGVIQKSDWVDTEYYPNDPFLGISRTHEVLIGFLPKDGSVSAKSLTADFESPPLLYAGWERYAGTGVILPSSNRADWPLAWQSWTTFASFWLHHRDLYSWYGFWDFGDFRHQFQSGAGWVLPPSSAKLAFTNKKTTAEVRNELVYDAAPTTDWAYDNGRWGWTNSEGLPNLFLQSEYLRNGNRAVYFASEAMARFARDVVVRHDGKWLGQGTRHGVQHWSDGNHEERQTTSTEYRLNYFLSGDGRTKDVVDKLYDQYYTKTPVEYEAAHSGRWGGLYFHWEMSGSPEEGNTLRKYAETFVKPEGLYLRPVVKFPGAILQNRPKTPENPMFFQYYGALHYLIEYQMVTGDEKLKYALIAEADRALKLPNLKDKYAREILSDDMYLTLMAFAAMHSEDPAPYREFLTGALRDSGWKMLYQTVSNNPQHWSGDAAFLRGYIPGCFFWANWAPFLTKSLQADDVASPGVLSEISGYDREGIAHGRPHTSWQSEFDDAPGLSKFLDHQKPWIKKTDSK